MLTYVEPYGVEPLKMTPGSNDMTIVIDELYFALIEAGASPEKAARASDVELWRDLSIGRLATPRVETTDRELNRIWWLTAINLTGSASCCY